MSVLWCVATKPVWGICVTLCLHSQLNFFIPCLSFIFTSCSPVSSSALVISFSIIVSCNWNKFIKFWAFMVCVWSSSWHANAASSSPGAAQHLQMIPPVPATRLSLHKFCQLHMTVNSIVTSSYDFTNQQDTKESFTVITALGWKTMYKLLVNDTQI